VQWAGRYATYSGSSPYLAPATLACIPAIEARYGAWFVEGGLGRVRDALVRAARAVGVELRTRSAVERIEAGADRVRAVRLEDGERLPAHVVVANVDAELLYEHLLPDPTALRRVQRAERSMSGFVVLAGVEGITADIAHHSVWFSSDDEAEFRALVRERRRAEDPTIYACVSSCTDPTQAPIGCENWFLLVNAPAGGTIRWDAEAGGYRDLLLERLAGRGVDLSARVRFTETITPDDLAARYRTPGGSIYGTSSNGRRAAFLRPANRGPRAGLYLVGGSSHPGGGLPLVATSARIVAAMVQEDGW
jgi:phytoene desaturase